MNTVDPHGVSVKDRERIEPADQTALLKEIYALPGNQALDKILEQDHPRELVQGLAAADLFWLVKKVGEDDCLPLLQLASEDQWHYLLDLEVWTHDVPDHEVLSAWMKRLHLADPVRFVRWLFREGEALAAYHLFKALEVVITRTSDEALDLPTGFFTLDGVFHLKVVDSEDQEALEELLRAMAAEDFERYQATLLSLAGLLPAEMEEEMYRLRNVRLAEHGFLPFDEAVAVYSPLAPEASETEALSETSLTPRDEELKEMAPILPLCHTGKENLLSEALLWVRDPVFLDRLRLEFAGLCNQILSADGVPIRDLEILVRSARRAASYLNLALERLCGHDVSKASGLLNRYPLTAVFRVGFSLALKLKWEADAWVKTSWFVGQGLALEFWGEEWGKILSGLVQKRPRFFSGYQEGGEEFRDFAWLSEVTQCLKTLHRLMLLDGLLDRIMGSSPLDESPLSSPDLTFHPLLFSYYARHLLNLGPDSGLLSPAEAKGLFAMLRAKDKGPPYGMGGFEKRFVDYFLAFASSSATDVEPLLRETLSMLWKEFREEYECISLDALEQRYSKYITIASP